ncbi:adhesion G-protein coupled receptor G5-like isoform X4 [Xiphophorus maculatus]|uniref:adhesion G-protein coupled receptor G5-like isoform X4 n=1 Tax=Xiphophorus maculatus TaxID=8083 RepID=UPI000C6F00FB|nr:adhesion G-protein coupled receptor G5-like isoform X4 [Xiphophorus maculatus]
MTKTSSVDQTTKPTTSSSTTVTPLTTTEVTLQTTLDKTTKPTTSSSTTVTPLTTTEVTLQTTLDTPTVSLGTSLSPLTTTELASQTMSGTTTATPLTMTKTSSVDQTTKPTTSSSTTVTPLTTTEVTLQTTLGTTTATPLTMTKTSSVDQTTKPTTSSSTTVTPLTTTEVTLETTLGTADAKKAIEDLSLDLTNKHYNDNDALRNIENLEQTLEKTDVNETTYLSSDVVDVLLYKNTDDFKGLEIQANNTEARVNASVLNIKVKIRIPTEFNLQKNDKVVFSMITLPNNTFTTTHSLYENLLVGLSVAGKNISGLRDRVSISIYLTTRLMKSQTLKCVFLDTTSDLTDISSNGCETLWGDNQQCITCSCDHLTYFAVLMVSADLSPKDAEILFYITYIGCGISLFALVVTVVLFITTRKLRADDSKKIHISLAVALILLNVHFLPSQAAAASSSTALCRYVALLLHYSLLASFTWMALEGFHLYLVLVKVFNIYMRRYLLKLSVVGWGLPAVIVTITVIIRNDIYGRGPLNVSKTNETICYIKDDTAKMVTTLGLFSVVFLFNVIMFGLTIKWYMGGDVNKQHGQRRHHQAKQEICTLLTLTVLLGLAWCLIFFSFGHLETPGLYSFCILNSLQGFSVSIYFVLSWKKSKEVELGTGKSSSETKSSKI